ncbi:MAG: hypothetical protein B7Y39_11975 [Bdellovibrio sp. 28-41-41]|nr:MAG: hypothetical protein B7Y39_11975 [Bdellovibrio sp. 28-41-41]
MDKILKLENQIKNLHCELESHSLYKKIVDLNSMKMFMETHVFAVWDFMSLLKRLQKDITCVTVPWRPSPHPKKLVRLINEIVLGEESDVDPDGGAIDHFSLYINAMKEVDAETQSIWKFIESQDYHALPLTIRKFVSFNINMAMTGSLHEVAGVFFFGREKLIPDMFRGLLKDIWKTESSSQFPKLKYYLERHVDLDGGEHSHLANEMLLTLCQGEPSKMEEALTAGIAALKLRLELWDFVESRLQEQPEALSV